MSNVISFAAARQQKFAPRVEEETRQAEEAGNGAWGRLKKASKKMSNTDRIELAKAMYRILEDLKQTKPALAIGNLAVQAEFTDIPNSRELYRLTLPPGKDPQKRGLRAYPEKYRRLLEAIQKVSKKSIALLADQLTWATSFHPKQVPGSPEAEMILSVLQKVINDIDKRFSAANGGQSLFDVFNETARAKVELAKAKSSLRWPYYDQDTESDECVSETEVEIGADNIPNGGGSSPRPEDDLNVTYAYWERDYFEYYQKRRFQHGCYPSGVAHHDALMHLPRICLGVADWDPYIYGAAATDGENGIVWPVEKDRRKHIEYLTARADTIGELRDPATGLAHIAHRHPATGEWIRGLSGTDHGQEYSADDSVHAWLVIYPAPDGREPIPVIYWPCSEGGTLLWPLTERFLITLKQLTFVDDGSRRSMYDRITELMPRDGQFPIVEAWNETARDVLTNPILAARRKQEAAEKDLACRLAEYLKSE